MVDINVTRINNFEYSFKLSSKEGIRHVAKALTFRNPDPFAYSSKIEKFDKRRFTFRIGMLPTLEKYIRVHNLTYSLTDYDYCLPEGVIIDNRMSGKYIHQKKAVEAFFRKRFGIIVVPTRGGKTFIASEILRIFLDTDEGNFLFLTDNTTLFTQAVNDIKEYFIPYGGVEVGEIKAGKIDTAKRVTVGIIQTIQSTFSGRCRDVKKKKSLEKYIRELKFLCVDEVHENCSDAKLKTYKKAKHLEYQLCLSATPYRAGTPTFQYDDTTYNVSDLAKEILLDGWGIALHGLNESLGTTGYGELQKVLNRWYDLAVNLNYPRRYITYTGGSYNRMVLEECREKGFYLGVMTQVGNINIVKNANPMYIPRFTVAKSSTSIEDLEGYLI